MEACGVPAHIYPTAVPLGRKPLSTTCLLQVRKMVSDIWRRKRGTRVSGGALCDLEVVVIPLCQQMVFTMQVVTLEVGAC